MKTVFVEVNGGVVTNLFGPSEIEWDVIDWDCLLGDVSPQDSLNAWERLAPETRQFVHDNYPDDYRALTQLHAEAVR